MPVLLLDAAIRGGVGADDEQLALALDFAGDLHGLGNHVEHLLVHRLAVA